MPTPPSSDMGDPTEIIKKLRVATDELRRAVSALDAHSQISAQLIAAAFAAVQRVSKTQLAARETVESTTELHDAMNDYRSALQQWYQQLPRVQGWLLTEKARLERRRAHADSLHSWLRTSNQTR